MASVPRTCPLSDAELCEQVKSLGEAVPRIERAQGDSRESLARIEVQLQPLPAIADAQSQILQRMATIEEHERTQDRRLDAIEQRQADGQKLVVGSMFTALLALLSAVLSLLGKR